MARLRQGAVGRVHDVRRRGYETGSLKGEGGTGSGMESSGWNSFDRMECGRRLLCGMNFNHRWSTNVMEEELKGFSWNRVE